ncbi:MAG TPA: hypothetical protein VGQ51_12870 [Puia sp.]|jgi:hypothetical protein|nr:hypothetical protein [Puia sp.]
MDKVLQILIVFGLILLFVYRMIRGREQIYRPYEFIIRLRAPLPAEVELRMVLAEDNRLETDTLFFDYEVEGRLTIYRRRQQARGRQVQELAVPVDCTAVAMDPVENKLYFEAGGYWFVYGQA